VTPEISCRKSEESDPDYHNEEGGSVHSSSESSRDKEVSTNSSEHLKGEMRSKKRHDAGRVEQRVRNDTREGVTEKVVERGWRKQVAGHGKGWIIGS